MNTCPECGKRHSDDDLMACYKNLCRECFKTMWRIRAFYKEPYEIAVVRGRMSAMWKYTKAREEATATLRLLDRGFQTSCIPVHPHLQSGGERSRDERNSTRERTP